VTALSEESGSPPARVVLVDDHALVREAVTATLARSGAYRVVGEAEGTPEALALVRELQPDVVVVDLSLRAGSGLELLRRLHDEFPRLQLLVLTMFDETVYGERVLRAGADGFLSKHTRSEEVLEALEAIGRGERVFRPETFARLRGRAPAGAEDDVLAELTDRELQVFELIGQGLGTRQIAERLHRSVHTIETHREKLKRKLDLHGSAELAKRAVEWVLRHE
jgi:DNA-binding NarL/FixJ family response regulator